jgi:hypothetical protein
VCWLLCLRGGLGLQKALVDPRCSEVVFEAPGAYLTKSLSLANCSHITVVIEAGAQLVVWRWGVPLPLWASVGGRLRGGPSHV